MDTFIQNKKILRNQILDQRKAWSLEKRANAANAMRQNLFALPALQQAQTVFCYVSTEFEIDTRAILQRLWQERKRVVIPYCLEKGVMCACEVEAFSDMQSGKFGILEPNPDCPKVEPSEISFAIVPALACDYKGNRLGYGGGYYDRYLAGNHMICAALCYDAFLYPTLPNESWDYPVQYIVTESKVYMP